MVTHSGRRPLERHQFDTFSPERVILFICFLKQQCCSQCYSHVSRQTLRNKEGDYRVCFCPKSSKRDYGDRSIRTVVLGSSKVLPECYNQRKFKIALCEIRDLQSAGVKSTSAFRSFSYTFQLKSITTIYTCRQLRTIVDTLSFDCCFYCSLKMAIPYLNFLNYQLNGQLNPQLLPMLNNNFASLEPANSMPQGLQALYMACFHLYPQQINPLQITSVRKYW